MTIGWCVAASAVVVAGMIESDLIPIDRVMADRAILQVVAIFGRGVAAAAIWREQGMIDAVHRPAGSIVAVGADIVVVTVWCAVAVDADSVVGVVKMDVSRPGRGRVTAGT